MPEKTPGTFQKIVVAASIVLWTFIIFCIGLLAAQTDAFRRTAKNFQSGEAQAEMLSYAKDPFDRQLTVWKDTPHGLQSGALLIGSQYSMNPALMLVDEDGTILHRWNIENNFFNLEILRWWTKSFSYHISAIDDAHLLPDGNVIFTQDLRDLPNFRGQRLARMDADSHIIWQVAGSFHDEFDIAADPQRIYAMASVIRDELPVIGPKLENVRYLDDVIYAYDMNGKKQNEWSVADAFADSPYSAWLSLFEVDRPDTQRVKGPDDSKRALYDLIGLDSVQYLDAAKARAIPTAEAGDLLISLRSINAIALLRPSVKKIVWADRGPWRHQHYVKVADDGKLYIYDNEGSTVISETLNGTPVDRLQSRVISYDPLTRAWQEIYASPRLHSFWRGYYYFLPGGDTLISSSQQSRVVVVTPDKRIVWELRGVPNRDAEVVPYLKQISTVRYYPPDALTYFTSSRNKP